jgi:ribonuclease HI
MTRPLVRLYCDGACSPNPGIGGWGVVLLSDAHGLRKELSGAEHDTSNNRMELTAALRGLSALNFPCRVDVSTDSKYVQQAFTQRWLERWQQNGWRTADKKPVKNEDLWRQLLAAAAQHEVRWLWVRGHGSDVENNRADALAVEARVRLAAQSAGGIRSGT